MVANEESDGMGTLGARPRDVPRLLRHPFAVGMRRAAGQVHATTGDFDEKQHAQPLEPDGVDSEKSTAMTLFACACRNSRHDGPLRVPAGPTRRRWVHWTLGPPNRIPPFIENARVQRRSGFSTV